MGKEYTLGRASNHGVGHSLSLDEVKMSHVKFVVWTIDGEDFIYNIIGNFFPREKDIDEKVKTFRIDSSTDTG